MNRFADSTFPGGWRVRHLLRVPSPAPTWWPVPATVAAVDWLYAHDLVLDPPVGPGWPRFKSDHSGDVTGGTLPLGGAECPVVVKRPRATRPHRRGLDLLRPSRARRAWDKTWRLIDAGLPAELPLMLGERLWRRGVVVDQVAVYARVPGVVLREADLDAAGEDARRRMLAGAGGLLRRVNRLGLCHHDAKTSNWVVHAGRRPILLDCDGVRRDRLGLRRRAGLDRLLRALREHPQYRPGDADAVRAGFAGRDATGAATLARLGDGRPD